MGSGRLGRGRRSSVQTPATVGRRSRPGCGRRHGKGVDRARRRNARRHARRPAESTADQEPAGWQRTFPPVVSDGPVAWRGRRAGARKPIPWRALPLFASVGLSRNRERKSPCAHRFAAATPLLPVVRRPGLRRRVPRRARGFARTDPGRQCNHRDAPRRRVSDPSAEHRRPAGRGQRRMIGSACSSRGSLRVYPVRGVKGSRATQIFRAQFFQRVVQARFHRARRAPGRRRDFLQRSVGKKP